MRFRAAAFLSVYIHIRLRKERYSAFGFKCTKKLVCFNIFPFFFETLTNYKEHDNVIIAELNGKHLKDRLPFIVMTCLIRENIMYILVSIYITIP